MVRRKIEEVGKNRKILVSLSVAMLLGIVFFGLNPKDFGFSNEVNWITDQSGIRFDKYGIAFSHPSNDWNKQNNLESTGFSIEIALKPKSYEEEGFNIIFAIHDGNDRNQLIIGQWRSHIITMNGDDYSHKRGIKRISINADLLSPTKLLLTITSGQEGTKVYVDGQLSNAKKDLKLTIPRSRKSRLVLGNSVYGKHSWRGDIFGLAIYKYVLSSQNIKLHFDKWYKERNFVFAKKELPQSLYMFDDKKGELALDITGGAHHLKIPRYLQILKRKILVMPGNETKLNSSFFIDFVLNIVGFVPAGFILTALFVSLKGGVEKYSTRITVLICLIISLIIEIAQSWMPSRSSQLLDLMLNTFGAWLGVALYQFSLRCGIWSQKEPTGRCFFVAR